MTLFEETAAFQKELLAKDFYRTPDERPPGLWGGVDVAYYARLVDLLWRNSRQAASESGYSNAHWASASYEFLRIVESTGAKVQIEGLSRRAALKGPCVVAGNHMSLVETFLLPLMLLPFDRMAVVTKSSLMTSPLIGPLMRWSEPVAVARKNPREDLKAVIEQGAAKIAAGRSMALFPQATRDAHFQRRKFNSLGVKLAKAAGVPIVPLAVKTDFQGNGRLIKDFGPLDRSKTVHMSLGDPIAVEGTGKRANERVMDFIEGSLAAWSKS